MLFLLELSLTTSVKTLSFSFAIVFNSLICKFNKSYTIDSILDMEKPQYIGLINLDGEGKRISYERIVLYTLEDYLDTLTN